MTICRMAAGGMMMAVCMAAHGATDVGISASGHYFRYNGATVLVSGDAGTQVVTMNGNVDYRAWIDHCAQIGQKAVCVWSWAASPSDQVDKRLGVYNGLKALRPWKVANGKFDFLQDNSAYWTRLDGIASYAKQKGLILVVTVFWGWAKDGGGTPNWNYHPMKDGNAVQSGLCTAPEQVQELFSSGTEIHAQSWDAGWSRAKKIQWIWERFALRLIEIADKYGNVIFDYRDEWTYSNTTAGTAEPRWRSFFRERGQLWADRSSQADWRVANPTVSPLGASPTMKTEGAPYDHDGVRVEVWTRATGGIHYFLHNDGRDPNIAAFDPSYGNDPYSDAGRKYVGYCSRFFNQHVANLDAMVPNNGLVSGNARCLADPGREYAIYIPQGQVSVTVDLKGMHSGGKAWFYDVRSGMLQSEMAAGGSANAFSVPSPSKDWALLIRGSGGSGSGTNNPTEPILAFDKQSIAFAVSEGYTALPGAQTVSVSNAGAGTLPPLRVTLNDLPWLRVTVHGTGNGQILTNQVIQSGVSTGTHTGSVLVSGDNLSAATYLVTLTVSARTLSVSARQSCPSGQARLQVGQVYTVGVDAYTGDEATAQPKIDLNDGQDGDSPYYQRHNITKAHKGGCDKYWYSSEGGPDNLGNPDPGVEQWVDYKPPFECLGEGRYLIKVWWRVSENRAKYAAEYSVYRRGGVDKFSILQNQTGECSGECGCKTLGSFDMVAGSYVRVGDPGTGSLVMARMEFTLEKAALPIGTVMSARLSPLAVVIGRSGADITVCIPAGGVGAIMHLLSAEGRELWSTGLKPGVIYTLGLDRFPPGVFFVQVQPSGGGSATRIRLLHL